MSVIPFPAPTSDGPADRSLNAHLMEKHPLRPSRRRMVRLSGGLVGELVASNGRFGVVRLPDGTLTGVGKVPRGAQ